MEFISHGGTANTESMLGFECFVGWFGIENFEIGVGWIHYMRMRLVIESWMQHLRFIGIWVRDYLNLFTRHCWPIPWKNQD